MDHIVDAHYFMLPTQGNVYSLAILNLCSGLNRFIVASLKKKIFSFTYCESSDGIMKPTIREISCTYIPSGAEIISVDAFNKSNTCDDFQIGIAIAKLNTEGSPETYLNIYSEQDVDSNYTLNIDSIAQNCLMVELNFIPYYLTHAFFLYNKEDTDSKEMAWLLSGSDCKIHVFQEDHQNHSYNETDITEVFPELINFPSVVTWIDIQYTNQYCRRISVVGCECGTVQLFIVNTKSNTILSSYSDDFDGPISQVKLFSLIPNGIEPPDIFRAKEEKEENSRNYVHLIVCNSLGASVVYMNVEEEGISRKYILERSEQTDSCVCCCVADINMDGYSEILLGTYGHNIVIYKWTGSRWKLCSQRSTASPVHSLHYIDLIGDGVNELVVQTLSGIHIMQHEPEQMHHIILSRLEKLKNGNSEPYKDDVTDIPETEAHELLPEVEDCPHEVAGEQFEG